MEELSLSAQLWVAVISGVVGALGGAAASWVVVWWRSALYRRENVRDLSVDVIASARGLWSAAQDLDAIIIELMSPRTSGARDEIFPSDEDGRLESRRVAEEQRQECFRLRRISLERGEHATAALALVSAPLEGPAAALLRASKQYTHKDHKACVDRQAAALRSFTEAVKKEVRTKDRSSRG